MLKTFVSSLMLTWIGSAPTVAQSPNTATLIITVVDQTGAVVPGFP